MTWMICLFGGIGAMARYVLDVSIQRSWNRDGNHSFPLATLVINGVASLCAGIAMMSYYAQSVDMGTVMTFVVGFLGGFSTFSSAINEVLSLIRKRRFAMALAMALPRSRCRSPAWRSDSVSPCWAATHSCHRLGRA